MTAIHYDTTDSAARPVTIRVPNVFAAVARGWAGLRHRQHERAAIVRISRMSPRLIRDMGIDPEAIYAALDGSWDEIDATRFSTRR